MLGRSEPKQMALENKQNISVQSAPIAIVIVFLNSRSLVLRQLSGRIRFRRGITLHQSEQHSAAERLDCEGGTVGREREG